MTKTFRSTLREYQKSPPGAANGVTSNPLARVSGSNGSFSVSSEGARAQLTDTTFGAFVAATHEGRLITLTTTPPTQGGVTSGSALAENWTFRIPIGGRVDADTIILEGFRTDVSSGATITWVIHAAADFTAATADFPQDTGPTGTDGDGEDRSNSGPVEWQSIHLPTAIDQRLRFYPFWVTSRTSATVIRISDPYDNLVTIPAESSLQWALRDRPAPTYEQLFKIIHQFLLHCGWELFQFRGKNNGVGGGGDFNDNVYCMHDVIYRSLGEDSGTVMFLRMAMFHRNSDNDGTDSLNNWGLDFAMYSAWDRSFSSVTVGGSTTSNIGNGINALSCHNSVSNTNRWAAQADTINTASNSEPYFSPDANAQEGQGSAFASEVAFSSPFDFLFANRIFRPNNLNTPEGGDVCDIAYTFFGSKDEINLYISVDGYGTSVLSFGRLKIRADAQPNNFVTNFTTPNGSNVLVRIGGPGTADGTDPTATTPPYQIGDRIQSVGQTVNSPIVPATSHAGELIDSSQVTDLPGLVAPIGILICPTGGGISDGDTFILNDGVNPAVTFEFDDNASVSETDTLRQVIFTGGDSADTVRNTINTAIGNAPTLDITSSNPISARVDLVNDVASGVGNIAIVDTNNVFLAGTEGMDGGGYAIEIANLASPIAAGALVGEDPQPMFFFRPNLFVTPFTAAPGASQRGIFRVSNKAGGTPDATYRDHNGPGPTVPPNSNGFPCVADLAGLPGPDTRDVNPNQRSGRFAAMAVHCRDELNDQLRGSMRYNRMTSPRAGSKKLVRDRNGDWHMLLQFGDRVSATAGDASSKNLVMAWGPMPDAMVII